MRNRDRIENIVRKDLDVRASEGTYDRLRDIVLNAHAPAGTTGSAATPITMRRTIMRIATLKIAVAALIGTGMVTAGAVVGVKYHFLEKRPVQGYLVQSEDGSSVMNITENHAASPEEAVQTAEEIARLKQQGQRELVRVGEIEVNGQLDGRVLCYDYHLADGRTINVGERDPEDNAPWTLVGERQAEAGRLLRETVSSGRFVMTAEGPHRLTADGQEIPTFERVLQGRTFTFQTYTFTLSDGTQVAWSLGKLKNDQ